LKSGLCHVRARFTFCTTIKQSKSYNLGYAKSAVTFEIGRTRPACPLVGGWPSSRKPCKTRYEDTIHFFHFRVAPESDSQEDCAVLLETTSSLSRHQIWSLTEESKRNKFSVSANFSRPLVKTRTDTKFPQTSRLKREYLSKLGLPTNLVLGVPFIFPLTSSGVFLHLWLLVIAGPHVSTRSIPAPRTLLVPWLPEAYPTFRGSSCRFCWRCMVMTRRTEFFWSVAVPEKSLAGLRSHFLARGLPYGRYL
jgi:hypothetical protein